MYKTVTKIMNRSEINGNKRKYRNVTTEKHDRIGPISKSILDLFKILENYLFLLKRHIFHSQYALGTKIMGCHSSSSWLIKLRHYRALQHEHNSKDERAPIQKN